MEKCRRREVWGDVTSSVCFHLAYDNSRKRLESLTDEELRNEMKYHKSKSGFDFWLSKYLPSLGYAGMNALVDLAEEKRLISRIL